VEKARSSSVEGDILFVFFDSIAIIYLCKESGKELDEAY